METSVVEFLSELMDKYEISVGILVPLSLIILIISLVSYYYGQRNRHRYQRNIAMRIYQRLQSMEGEGTNGRRLNYLRKIDPFVFEELILYALERRGYQVIRNKRYTGDGGIDGQVIVNGVKIPIQAKRYSFHIKQRHVREFSELVKKKKKQFGLFVHTGRTGRGSFSSNYPNVQIISGNRLIKLLSVPEENERLILKMPLTGSESKSNPKNNREKNYES